MDILGFSLVDTRATPEVFVRFGPGDQSYRTTPPEKRIPMIIICLYNKLSKRPYCQKTRYLDVWGLNLLVHRWGKGTIDVHIYIYIHMYSI